MTQGSARTAAAPGRDVVDRVTVAARRILERLVHEWRRSLQFRVGATTLIVTGLVVLLIGIFLVGQLSGGVLRARRDQPGTARAEHCAHDRGWRRCRSELRGSGRRH
jgi:hypothetical protein